MSTRKRGQPLTASVLAQRSKQPRFGPSVSRLRHDETFTDAEICVEDETFPIHRNIIGLLSDFFLKSFAGPFAEAEKRSLRVEEASPSAVSILLNFEYGIDMTSKMKNELDLACEVASLSHRFDAKKLTDIAAAGACSQLNIGNCMRLLGIFKRLDHGDSQKVFLFIVHRLQEFSSSPGFKTISIDDLKSFVSSRDARGTEFELYHIIEHWLDHNSTFKGTEEIAGVFRYVNFEFLGEAGLQYLPKMWAISMPPCQNRQSDLQTLSSFGRRNIEILSQSSP